MENNDSRTNPLIQNIHLLGIQKALSTCDDSEKIQIWQQLEATLNKFKPEVESAMKTTASIHNESDTIDSRGTTHLSTSPTPNATDALSPSNETLPGPSNADEQQECNHDEVKKTHKHCTNCGKIRVKHSDVIELDTDSSPSSPTADNRVLCYSESSEEEANHDLLNIEYVPANIEYGPLWSKGKSSQSSHKLLIIKESLGSSVNLSGSTLDGISESGQSFSSKRKESMKQQNTEQFAGQLECRLKQKEQELKESQDQLQVAQEEILNLISENEALPAKNFGMNDQVQHLKIIVKEFCNQNRAMDDEKQQLVAAMEVKGWLFKRGIRGRLWRKRYFQNNGFFLSYYKSPSTQVEQGSIDLRKVSEISILCADKQDKNSASFNIITEQRVYELQARNPEEMNSWIRAVNYLMNYHKDNMLQSYSSAPLSPGTYI